MKRIKSYTNYSGRKFLRVEHRGQIADIVVRRYRSACDFLGYAEIKNRAEAGESLETLRADALARAEKEVDPCAWRTAEIGERLPAE